MTARGRHTDASGVGLDPGLQARLPLPLARLYGRAVCAVRLRDRHQAACLLLEVTAKLAAAIEVARYQDALLSPGGERDPAFDALLLKLALPSPGAWSAILRARAADGSNDSEPRGPASILITPRDDLPATRAAITLLSGGGQAPATQVAPALLVDSLHAYHAQLIRGDANGAPSAYWDVTEALIAAFTEWTQQTDLLGTFVLRAVQGVRSGVEGEEGQGIRVSWLDLRGPQPRRMRHETLTVPCDLVSGHVCWLGHDGRWLPLNPLVLLHGTGAFCRFYLLDAPIHDASEARYVDPITGRARHPARADEPGSDVLFADLRRFLQACTTREVNEEEYWRLRDAVLEDADSLVKTSLDLRAVSAVSETYGPYTPWGQLAQGATGVTHLASPPALDTHRMVTVLPPASIQDPAALSSLRRQLGAVARCDHPNVLRILDTGESEGSFYYATELPIGCSVVTLGGVLADTQNVGEAIIAGTIFDRQPHHDLKRLPKPSESRFPAILAEGVSSKHRYRALAWIFAGFARGLHQLHAQGVVHREISPRSLLVSVEDGRGVVLAPELAPQPETDDPNDGSRGGQIWEDAGPSSHASGSPSPRRHVAPEQILLSSHEVDPRADIYGLGATLYEVVTGQALFSPIGEESLAKLILERSPREPSSVKTDVPAALEGIILRCIAKDPEDRFATAAELTEALEQVAQGGQWSAARSARRARRPLALPDLSFALKGLQELVAGKAKRSLSLKSLAGLTGTGTRPTAVGLAAVLLALTLGAFGVCSVTNGRDRALQSLARVRSGGLVAASKQVDSEEPALAAFLAREAVKAHGSVEAISQLYATLQQPIPTAVVRGSVVAAEPLPSGNGFLLVTETSVSRTDRRGKVLWRWKRPAPTIPDFPLTVLPELGLLLTLHQGAPAAVIGFDGQLVSRLHGDPVSEHDLSIAPDGTVLAVGGSLASLWRLRRGQVTPGSGLGSQVVAGSWAWAPDGQILAMATADNFIEVRAPDGTMVSQFPLGAERGAVRVAFLDRGERLLAHVAGDDGRSSDAMKLWSLTGDPVERWSFPKSRPRPVLWSDPSAQSFVLTWPGGRIDVHGSDGKKVCSVPGDGKPERWTIDVAATGMHFVASGRGRPVLFSMQCGRLASLGEVSHGFSRDGTRLLAAEGRSLRVWAAEGHPLASLVHPEPVLGARFCAEGQEQTVASWTARQVFAWNIHSGLTTRLHHGKSVERAFLAEGGRTVVTEHAGVSFWYLDEKMRAQGRSVLPETHFVPQLLPPGDRLVVRVAHPELGKGAIWSRVATTRAEMLADVYLSEKVEYRTDGELFVGLIDRIVRDGVPDAPRPVSWLGAGIWRRDGERQATLQVPDDEITSVALLPDGQHVSTGHVSGTVRIWSAKGPLLRTFPVGRTPVTRLASSATDDALFVLCGLQASVWRPDNNLLWEWVSDNIGNGYFTPAGDRLITEPFTTFTHAKGFKGTAPEDWGPVRVWTTKGTEVKLDTQCPLHYVPSSGFPVLASPDAAHLVVWCEQRAEVLDLDGKRLVTLSRGGERRRAGLLVPRRKPARHPPC